MTCIFERRPRTSRTEINRNRQNENIKENSWGNYAALNSKEQNQKNVSIEDINAWSCRSHKTEWNEHTSQIAECRFV